MIYRQPGCQGSETILQQIYQYYFQRHFIYNFVCLQDAGNDSENHSYYHKCAIHFYFKVIQIIRGIRKQRSRLV